MGCITRNPIFGVLATPMTIFLNSFSAYDCTTVFSILYKQLKNDCDKNVNVFSIH